MNCKRSILPILMGGIACFGMDAYPVSAPSLQVDCTDGYNQLVKTMTGIDPLTQQTITTPPYGVEGWMPIGADSLVRFNGRYYPNSFNRDGESYTFDESHSYIQEKTITLDVKSPETYNYQPFAITVQQRRENGRRTEPVVVYFVADRPYNFGGSVHWVNGDSYTAIIGDIYVQSMIKVPECTNIGHHSGAVWNNLYTSSVLIHQTRPQDDMIHGSYSNNIKRNEAFDALVSASACDLDGDGYDEIVVFYSNTMDIFDGKTFAFRKSVSLRTSSSGYGITDGFERNSLSYGYDTYEYGNIPNTWTSVVSDIDGDGEEDILAICHNGFYWDHLTDMSPESDSDVTAETGNVRCVFIPGGKGMDTAPVISSLGSTPQLMWNAKDGDIYRYRRIPRWSNTSYNNHDGIFNHDMYHYYHVTLTADVIYPNGMFNSNQPVLAIAWKYLWSDSPTQHGDVSYTDRQFREGLHEWYQLTTYNLTDNMSKFTQTGQGTPVCDSKVDIYQLLNKANEWHEAYAPSGVSASLYYSPMYNNAVNARASLRRPALKTWYAGGRTMPPFLFFEGMNLYLNPALSGDLDKYTIASANALGYDSGWTGDINPCGRICGPIYTYYDHVDEDGALDDRESIMVPVATRSTSDSDPNRYQDNEYRIVTGRFSQYGTNDMSVTKVTSSSNTIGSGPSGQNSIFHSVPFMANTAKVELQESYFTASNPIIKAVLAIPPYNVDDVVDTSTAQISFSTTSDQGTEQGNTTSTTVGGGFSMELSLFQAFKLGYSYSYEQSWDKSWGKSYTMTSTTGYASSLSHPSDMVIFNYIPVDCFVYEVTQAPHDGTVEGKTFTFRRALNMLGGEAHMPEVCWTVEDYNKWVAEAGLPHIDKSIFPHKTGIVDSYRRIPKFLPKESIISYFPRKENGFYAVHDGGTAGSTDIIHALSISNGQSSTVGGSFSHTNEISFGFEKEGIPFACSVNGKFGTSEAWESTTSWTSTMGVSGTVPAIRDVRNSFDFYQVWYEYYDEESGQDFLVCDWAVGQNSTSPVYTNLELVQLYDLDVPAETETYYLPQLEWSVMSNTPVHHCVLEYKLDGMTPIRNNEDAHALVTLDNTITDWTPVEKTYDNEAGQWVDSDFSNTDNTTFASWEHFDYFTLTSEQKNIIRAAVGDGSDIYVHYRVKIYQAVAGSDEYILVDTSNEVSAKMFSGQSELAVSNTMTLDLFSLPYGNCDSGEWTKTEHLNGNSNIFYGNDINENNYVDLTIYDQLYLHGLPNQKYYLYFNGPTPFEVTLDANGNTTIDLADHMEGAGYVFLRGIRAAEGDIIAADAFARVSKSLGDRGVQLSGYAAFPTGYENLTFYEATGVQNESIEFPLDNPNAIVVGDSNITGVMNLVNRSTDVVQGLTAETLSIYDGFDFCYDYSVECDDVMYKRDGISEESRYVTCVMPFAIHVEEGDGIYEYIDCDGRNVYFNTPDDGVIDAYLPIVVNVEEAIELTLVGKDLVALIPNGVFNLTDAPSSKTNMKYGFVTKRQEHVSVNDNEDVNEYNVYGYSINSHQFVKVTNQFSISPFRAFFLLPKNEPAQARSFAAPATIPAALNIVIDGTNPGDINGIEDVTVQPEQGDGVTYNLLGIPVAPGYRGIAIRNGKKIIIR